jgi:hypothetical protein
MWKPREYPTMNAVLCAAGIPVIDCSMEFRNNDLLEDHVVYKSWKEGFPGLDESNDRLWVEGCPGIIDG